MTQFAQVQKKLPVQQSSIHKQVNSTPEQDYENAMAQMEQSLTPARILSLQQTHGNHFVSRLVQRTRINQDIPHLSSLPLIGDGIAQRMTGNEVLNGQEKKDFEKCKKNIEDHNKNPQYKGYEVLWNTVLGRSKDVAALKQETFKAITAAKQKAESAKLPAQQPEIPAAAGLVALPPKGLDFKEQAESRPKQNTDRPARPPQPTQSAEEQALLSSLFGSAPPTAIQQPAVQPKRTYVAMDIAAIRRLMQQHPAGTKVTSFAQSNSTSATLSFEVRVEETTSPGNISVYDFVIHYHPDGTGNNPLHAKVDHDGASNLEISKKNWLINSTVFNASVEGWKTQYGQKV